MDFADVLQKLMSEHEMSNYKLAKELGCSQTTVSNWLSGSFLPQNRAKKQLCDLFGVSENYLLGLSPEQQLAEATAQFAEVSAELDADPDNFDLQCRYDALNEQIEDAKLAINLSKDEKNLRDVKISEAEEEILMRLRRDPGLVQIMEDSNNTAFRFLCHSAHGKDDEDITEVAKFMMKFKDAD